MVFRKRKKKKQISHFYSLRSLSAKGNFKYVCKLYTPSSLPFDRVFAASIVAPSHFPADVDFGCTIYEFSEGSPLQKFWDEKLMLMIEPHDRLL